MGGDGGWRWGTVSGDMGSGGCSCGNGDRGQVGAAGGVEGGVEIGRPVGGDGRGGGDRRVGGWRWGWR